LAKIRDIEMAGHRGGPARPPAGAREPGFWQSASQRMLRDPIAIIGMALVAGLVLAALLAPVIAPADPSYQFSDGLSLEGSPLSPASAHLLGTDGLGRDELSRLLYGARVSLAVGIAGNVLAALIGLVVGGLAGLARPWIQSSLMRVVDVILSFPILLLAIVLLAVTKPSLRTIILIVGVSFGAYLSRLVFSQVVSLREREYVLAARTAGVRTGWILIRHIIPHVLPVVIVYCTLGVATAIMLEASLSYVGIGIQPPAASWGNMIADGQPYLVSAAWLVIAPASAIMLATIGFSLLGDGLRDALDPTLEQRAGVRSGIRTLR
jgi:peptide/nickel transport system permease protein